MATVFKSKEPCFVCQKREQTVQVKIKEVSVPLCLEHMYEKLEEKPKKSGKKE